MSAGRTQPALRGAAAEPVSALAPRIPATRTGSVAASTVWWAPAEEVLHLDWRRGRSVRRHVVGHVLCLDLGLVVESVEPGGGQRPLSLPCVRPEVRLVA